MAIVNEVITQFSFEGSTQPLVNYNSSLGKSIGLLASMSAAIVGAAGAMAAFVTSTTKAIDPMIQLSRSTGVAIGAIQELGFAASVTGSDAQTLQGSIAGLSEKIGEAAQKGSEEFARLGISVRDLSGEVKTADQVLLEIGKRFNELDLSLPERRSFAQSLGIDPSLVQLLSLTGSEIDKTRAKARELGIVTKEQADAAASLNDSMTTLKFGLDGVRNSVAVGLAPQIEEITSGFIDFLAANREVITNGISKVIEFTTALAKAVVRLTPVITGIVAAFGVWKIATIGLGKALAVAFAPVTLITAGIVGLLLVVDDLIVAFNGGKSVVASFFQEFFGVDIVPPLRLAVAETQKLLDHMEQSSKTTFSSLRDATESFMKLFRGEFGSSIEFINTVIPQINKAFDSMFLGVFSKARGFGVDIGSEIRRTVIKISDEISEALKQFIDDVKNIDFIGVGKDIADELTKPIRDAFSGLIGWIKTQFERISSIPSGFADLFGFGENEPENINIKVTQQRQVNTEVSDGNAGADNTKTLDPQEVKKLISVKNLIESDGAGPILPEISDINATRVINLRELMSIQSAVMPVANDDVESPLELMRNVSLINQFEQFGDVDAPEISPLELTRQIAVNNAIGSTNLNDAVMSAQGVLSIEAQNQQRLLPQPQAFNSNERSITVEQNNEINVTSENPRAIASPITDALQSQLADAEAQLRSRAI